MRSKNENKIDFTPPRLPGTIPGLIWHFARLQKFAIISLFALAILRGVTSVFWPYSAKLIVDAFQRFVKSGAVPETMFGMVGGVILLYFAVYIIAIATNRGVKFLANITMPRFMMNVKAEVLHRVQYQSYNFFINHFAGNIATKINDLGAESRNILRHLWHICEIIAFIAASFMAFTSIHWQFMAVSLTWGALFLGFCAYRMKLWNALSKDKSESSSIATGKMIDSIQGYSSVKSFAGETAEHRYVVPFFKILADKSRLTWFTINKDYLFLDIFTFFFLYVPTFYMIYTFFGEGKLGLGDIAFIIAATDYVYEKVSVLSDVITEFSESYGAMQQAMWVVTTPMEIKDREGAKPLNVQDARIAFRDVEFRYPSRREPLFKGFNLDIRPGEKVGIVGHSGAGKSSIVHLLLRYFDVDKGAVEIDGQDIKASTQESLHHSIAFIPQDTSLFHRTILENIRYGRPNATKHQVVEAAKKAFAHDLILATPDGYDSLVGDRGIKLSVGQRQRIAIARAILKDAPILILDEATSALDSETEVNIQKSLEALMEGRTTIAIAHRLSTLRHMDRIIVIEDGKIVEEGSHAELLKKKRGRYARLWSMQSNGFIGD